MDVEAQVRQGVKAVLEEVLQEEMTQSTLKLVTASSPPTRRGVDLTPVGGQTRVSDMNADERGPHDAGSDTKLPAGIQTRGRPPCPLLTEQERRPDSQRTWRLGQLSEELG